MHLQHRTNKTLTILALSLLTGIFAGSCGGGGGNRITQPGLVATFSGSPPVAGSISMQPGAHSGSLFEVRIDATDIPDLFGASFRVTFDDQSTEFVDVNSSNSILNEQGILTEFTAAAVQDGMIAVTASRIFSEELAFNADPPAAGTVSMQQGTVNGEIFEVLITATDIDDFFGTAFRINYDPTNVSYLDYDPSSSFLSEIGVGTDFQVSSVHSGVLAVVATRIQNAQGTVPGVNVAGTQTLMSLRFEATDYTTGNLFFLGAPREVLDSAQPVSNEITVSWANGTFIYTKSEGIDVIGTQNLITLTFRATEATANSAFDFADPREICDGSIQPACNPIVPTYLGGTLAAN